MHLCKPQIQLWKVTMSCMYYFKTQLIYLLFILSVDNCFSVVLHVNSLKFQDSSSVSKAIKHLPEIFQLFNSSSVLCISSENQEISSGFLNLCQRSGVPIVLNYLTNELRFCNSIITLEKNNFTDCYKMTADSYKYSFYFFNFYSDMNVIQIEKCFSNSSSPEVIVLSNGSIFELSPVFPVPRHLKLSSVTQVLEHRREKYRLDLGGSQVSVAFMAYPPFSIFPDLNKPETGDGIEFTLVKELSRQLNFTVQYDVYQYWGLLMPNGTWHGEGLAQSMQERKADVAVANIWQIPSFYKILDFGPSLNKNSLAFLVRRPVQIDFQWQVFMTIFQPLVWIFIVVAFAVMVVVYQVVVSRDLHPQNQGWASSVLTIFGHFTMTTSTTPAHLTSSRPLLTAWSVFSLLVTTSLSTGIVSRLTLPLFSPRVDTHQHLVQGGFYWTVQYYRRFETAEIRNMIFDFDNSWSREFEQRYVYMEKEQVEQIINQDKKLAFPVQTYGDDFFIINTQGVGDQNDLQDFRRTLQVTQGCHLSWGVKKHSPLLRPLTAITHRFIQAGLTKQWRKQVVRRWPRYDVSNLLIELDIPTFREPEPLKLAKVQPILYLLVFGLAVATLVFFIEINW